MPDNYAKLPYNVSVRACNKCNLVTHIICYALEPLRYADIN